MNVPLLGLVNNMCCFTCPVCGTKHYIFGKGGAEKLAEESNVRILAEIPIDPNISECADAGNPIVLANPESEVAVKFLELADKVMGLLRNQ